MDSTTDPKLTSWLPVDADSHFPVQNLPYGVFRRGSNAPAVGVAIGEHILDLAELHRAGAFAGTPVADDNVFDHDVLNRFMAAGKPAWTAVRQRVSHLLSEGTAELRDDAALRERVLVAQSEVTMILPVAVRDYTDFYSSKEHASNVGSMFRDPSNPLLPNWLHIPVGYHGRASSIIGSDVPVTRPKGQLKPEDSAAPIFGASRLLDFELEMGFFTGVDTALGSRISTGQAADSIFGMVLVNDWSARDIQRWEYVPLGPFLSKSFATSISPWVVTLDALAPFRVPGPAQDPPVLPYLEYEGEWAFDLNLEVYIQSKTMATPHRVTATNFKYMYWNILQQLAHQTVGGTNIQVGDLYASGTVSGPTPDSRGSMLEICWKGTTPVDLPDGTQRKFILDGDSVIMRGWCQGDGYKVGFGELRNSVLPAVD